MRRHLFLLITVLTALLLSACGGGGTVVPAPTEAPAEAVTQAPVDIPTAAPTEDVTALVETAQIAESSHDREEGYAAMFSTHMLAVPGLSVHMQNAVYDEASLRGLAKSVLTDLETAGRASGVAPEEVTVYIVSATVDGIPEAVGTRVFCTADDLESGACRPALMGAAYGLAAEWQRIGLSEYVFNEEANGLHEYYADGGHALTASLSPLFLSPYSADTETVKAARETARSLTAYLLDKKGFSAFSASDDPAPYLLAWAEAEGITGLSALPEGHEKLADMRLVPGGRGLFEFSIDNFTVYVFDDSWIKTPDELYSWTCGFLAGLDKVAAGIAEELPSFRELLEERLSESTAIFMIDEMSGTYAYPSQNRIDLSRHDATWHEPVHLLLEESSYNESYAWMCEGLAEHFSLDVTTEYCPEYYVSSGFEAYLELFYDINGFPASEDDMIFHQKVWELYQELRSPGMEDHDDQYAYERAFGICKLLLDERLERTQLRRIYDESVAGKRGISEGTKRTDGNALSYPEAMVVLEYLFEHFGADDVYAAYYNCVPLERAFGITYTELYDAVMAELAERYPGV